MRFLYILIAIIIIPILTLFLGLQVIALGDFVKAGFQSPFKWEFNILRYLEHKDFLYLVVFLIFISIISVLWNTIFSLRAKERYKIRHITLSEKRSYSHLAGIHEAKKGTQRLEFNKKGQLKGNKTFKGVIDVIFDKPKRLWNKLITYLKINDIHKFNTLTNYKIESNESGRRSGIPVITKKNKVWVEAGDINSLIVGGTRSGKTYSIIHIMIQLCRMAKESMMVMDVKGELYMKHSQSLREDGYDVFRVDFIHPKKSIRWNPLGVIIKKYRKAYNDWLCLMRTEDNTLLKKKIATKTIILRDIQSKLKSSKSDKDNNLLIKEKILKAEIEELIENLPKPDYSKAKEYSLDIAMTLCMDDSKDPFWPSSAATLLDGYINFLLEEKMDDGNGSWDWLPDKMINMYSVKMLHDLGKTPLNPNRYDGCSNVLQYYVKHYRNIDDASSMKLKAYIDAPENTAGSISSVFDDKIKYFLANENILSMTSESEFELTQMGDKKTAIFVCIHDEKSTLHQLASIIFSQIYEELIEEARDIAEITKTDIQRLSRDIMVIWDEFANGAKWDNITNALAAGLSRGIRYNLVVQDYGQLESLYGDKKTKTIKSNCLNTIFLLANENQTLRDISERCGKGIRWDRNKNDKVTYDLVSIDRLNRLSMGEVVEIRARKNPFISRLLAFDDYIFVDNLPKTPFDEDREFDNTLKFNILKAWKQRVETDDKLQIELLNSKKSNTRERTSRFAKDIESKKKQNKQNSNNFSVDDLIKQRIRELKTQTDEVRKKQMNKYEDMNISLAEFAYA